MKLVIQTQIRENYAAHNGFNGEYRWKCKGGDTYVVPNLTDKQAKIIEDRGIPTLTALIEQRGNSYEEYILDISVVEDHETVCEYWKTAYELYWEQGRWVARRTVNNTNGLMRNEIASRIEQYDMMMGGERKNYSASYIMKDGSIVDLIS